MFHQHSADVDMGYCRESRGSQVRPVPPTPEQAHPGTHHSDAAELAGCGQRVGGSHGRGQLARSGFQNLRPGTQYPRVESETGVRNGWFMTGREQRANKSPRFAQLAQSPANPCKWASPAHISEGGTRCRKHRKWPVDAREQSQGQCLWSKNPGRAGT